ncbi:MAG: hypothetical protein U0R65_10680 [Candidatus Nanopelagicales bacterium]|jgi:hypothetical protein
MRPFTKAFNMFRAAPLDPEEARRLQIDREWQTLRASAMSESERAEIDAIFSRIV